MGNWADREEIKQMHSDIADEMWDDIVIVCNRQSMTGRGRYFHEGSIENMGDMRLATQKNAFQVYKSQWPGLEDCHKNSRNIGRILWCGKWFELSRISDAQNNYLTLSAKACPYDAYCRADTCNVDRFGPNLFGGSKHRHSESRGYGDRQDSGGTGLTRDSRPHRKRGY